MSNLSDLIKAITELNEDGVREQAGALLGLMADVSGAFGLLQLGYGLIQLFQRRDVELRDLLSSIEANFAQLNSLIKAQAKLERMGRVDQEISKAVAVFDQLLLFVSDPSLTDDFKLEQIGKCVEAVTFLSDNDDGGYPVYEETPYYEDAWSGRIAPPPPQLPLVFNYTYTLPQFLRAIYILVTAIGALEPTKLHQYRQVLDRAADRLQQVHDKIVNEGITGIRRPTNGHDIGYGQHFDQTTSEGGNDPGYYVVVGWLGTDVSYPYGAVERFSGSNNGQSYYPFVGYFLDGESVPVDHFFALLQLRIRAKQRDLYERLGLTKVRLAINRLRAITGGAQVDPPTISTITISEVSQILGIDLGQRHGRELLAGLREYLSHAPPFTAASGSLPPASAEQDTAPTPPEQVMPARPLPPLSAVVRNVFGRQEPGWPTPVPAPIVATLGLSL